MIFNQVRGMRDVQVSVIDQAQGVASDNPTRDDMGLGYQSKIKICFLVDGKSWGAIIDPISQSIMATNGNKIRIAR